MIPVMYELKNVLGVGIDELACLYYKNGIGTVYGEHGVIIADISEAFKVPGRYFQMKNVRLHYLSSGDSFNFKTKKITSTKAVITNPTYLGYADSNDILSSYECSRLITRLVDQVGAFNLGKTSTPADESYPVDTALFDLIFYKEEETKGYKKGDLYTVENAYLDISA
jgi:hypothetical protein